MEDIPPDILTRFSDKLRKRSAPVGLNSYYLKLLRYYLDYCSNYRLRKRFPLESDTPQTWLEGVRYRKNGQEDLAASWV
jgi:hypothetical protein